MPKLRLSISDPDVHVVESPEALWILSGFEKSDAKCIEERKHNVDDLEPELAVCAGDASIAKIHLTFGQAKLVEVWKPCTSCRDVFYVWTNTGDLLVTDHFRTALSYLLPVNRTVSTESIVDFFLFNTVPGTQTICSAINRVGHGDFLSIDLETGQLRSSIFDRIETREILGSDSDNVARLDAALSEVLEPIKHQEDVANLFSGGVDSVLIQSYLGNEIPAVYMDLQSLKIDSPYEVQYAQHAADLLSLELRTHPIAEAEYLRQLESTIDALARPPLFLTMIFYDQAFQLEHQKFLNGEAAGLLFGEGARLARAASYFCSPVGIAALRFLMKWLPTATRPGWKTLVPNANALSEDPHSSLGYGARSATDTDFRLMEQVFGIEIVHQRLDARLEYLLQRLVPAAPSSSRFFQHVEIAQWMEYLCSDHMAFWRQIAQSHSKSLLMPYTSGRVTSIALEIPIVDRYIRGFQGKYLLKQLLSKRVPDYAAYQRKGYSHVSFNRYYESGPLSDVWQRYQHPDFLDQCPERLVVDKASPLTWHAVAYAVWQDRALKNSNVLSAPVRFDREWAF